MSSPALPRRHLVGAVLVVLLALTLGYDVGWNLVQRSLPSPLWLLAEAAAVIAALITVVARRQPGPRWDVRAALAVPGVALGLIVVAGLLRPMPAWPGG